MAMKLRTKLTLLNLVVQAAFLCLIWSLHASVWWVVATCGVF